MTTINFAAASIGRPLERQINRTGQPAAPTAPAHPATIGWLDRLAAWAERQPMHRRVGSCSVL